MWPPTLLLLLLHLVTLTSGHVRFMRPLSRASLWRDERYRSRMPEIDYNDNQLFCGGAHVSVRV